jgi:hypothetical protein
MASKAQASQAWPWPDELDALVAAPKHHTLLFENDEVRVLDVVIPAGETVPLHTHRWPSVLYLIRFANFLRRDENGKLMMDTRKHPAPSAPMASWAEPFTPHTVENVDTVAFHGVAVEMKG